MHCTHASLILLARWSSWANYQHPHVQTPLTVLEIQQQLCAFVPSYVVLADTQRVNVVQHLSIAELDTQLVNVLPPLSTALPQQLPLLLYRDSAAHKVVSEQRMKAADMM